ncbi:MAG: hypothetical protein HKN63_10845 [Rhodobacteraceae bacterium]|nr:hypothetical protein [Paracoccaceae bacterium]
MKERLHLGKAVASIEASTGVAIMAVGDVKEWLAQGKDIPSNEHLALVEFHDITRARLEILSPKLIVSPLLAHNFDCIDLAQLLSALDYKGAYRAIAATLPNPRMIKREISSICPDLDFQILLIEGGGGTRLN